MDRILGEGSTRIRSHSVHIEGSGLHITKLSLDEGQVIVEGEILALEYSEDAQQRGSLFSRMFR